MNPYSHLARLGPDKAADWVLDLLGISNPPVDVRGAATDLGFSISNVAELEDDVSGMFVARGDNGVIGVNRKHPRVRQRFTIAHELGHALLHRGRMELFVDTGYGVAFRDSRSSTGEIKMEREANAFAAALLMPESMVRKEIGELSWEHGIDYGGGKGTLKEMAQRFKVSQEAMSFRLARLGVFSS